MKLDAYVTDDEVAELTESQVFEWIKTGHWSKSEFMRWVMVTQAREFDLGVETAKINANHIE